MPHSKEPKQRLRLASPDSSKYDVGFGKPPEATRFRPGQSGNPRGRPRGSKNRMPALNEERLKTIVLEEAYRTIKVRDGEKSISIPMAKAVVRSLALFKSWTPPRCRTSATSGRILSIPILILKMHIPFQKVRVRRALSMTNP